MKITDKIRVKRGQREGVIVNTQRSLGNMILYIVQFNGNYVDSFFEDEIEVIN